MVARKETMQEMGAQGEGTGSATEMDSVEEDNSRRYCEACEVMVHNNHNWLMHMAGE